MACIPIPVDPIFECLLGLLKCAYVHGRRHAGYLKNHEKNYETLRTENEILGDTEVLVNDLVRDEDRKGRYIRREAFEWQKKAQKLKGEAESVLTEFQDAQGRCTCCCSLPNCWYCYRRGKAAGRKHKEVTAHIKEAPLKAEEVSRPPPINWTTELNTVALDGQETATRVVKEILDSIDDATISRIGVYGMGGIGKTTIMRNVHNKVKGFDFVMYVLVGKDPDCNVLQRKIARYLYLSLPEGADQSEGERMIAEKLRGRKYLLILDDVWQGFDLHVLGVSDPPGDGSKVVVVSRSLHVCHFMVTNKDIKVEVMSPKDAMSLFLHRAGDVINQPTINEVAMEVLRECGGLPIAINTIGAALRNNDDEGVWKDTLRALRQSTGEIQDMKKNVYDVLQVSYDLLDDTLQSCFKYFSLFPENEVIFTYFLSVNWYMEGYMGDNINNFKEIVDKGRTIISRLLDACLLESGGYARNVSMHDLIRDLAVQLSSSGDEPMGFTKTGRQVLEAPTEEEWKKAKIISLMRTSIEELPERPDCPQLKTLLLEGCEKLRAFHAVSLIIRLHWKYSTSTEP